jgi:hypothetical protein
VRPVTVGYTLSGPIPAGPYHLIADGFVSDQPVVRFEILWRRAGTSDEMPIVIFEHQYPANPVTFSQYEETQQGAAVPARDGDLLVLRMGLVGGAPVEQAAYVPVGEIQDAPAGARFLTIDIPR